jgi:ABC-type lipoprotein release transport system permease subunit
MAVGPYCGGSGHDIAESRREFVVVINEKMAHCLWPGESAIGRVLLIDEDPGAEWKIVGVVGNVRQGGLEEDVAPEMYMMGRRWAQELVVRSKGTLASIAPSIRATLRQISPEMPVDDFQSLDEVVAKAVSPKRLTTLLLILFSVQALVLASLGVYGVIAYSVSQRTREIGIRLAIGSTKTGVLRLIIHEGMKVALIGCAVGLAASFALTRIIRSLLFHVSPTDPLAFCASGFLVVLVALLACWLPARRATRINPMLALRCE